ncbi:septation ring formation regulator EzrA [Lacicoccus alkaliphilus]|uniref:Septation ring formation regulator n=1 Tax=Lacicoccus alkaliphilus DSM 16010 TaxID=1123231 RepID=A0A1M7AKI6_9BACL|nr:septation ring formation regulator EzrA [Salinicoccus alkaliphilus]SHL43248.1 septation ring formation regulator [Salinicoccus alkaliphilus DSM 16010]
MWVYLLIGIIVLIAISVAVVFYIRNTKLEDINYKFEKLEEVRALPFQDELFKVKDLNLHGEAKKLYAGWQKEWQTSLKEALDTSENRLSDAKRDLEKFKFNDSNAKVKQAETEINQAGSKYDQLTSEIDELVQTGEKSAIARAEAEKIHREAKRDVLASAYQFGDASGPLEELIDSFEPEINEYDVMINGGNYVSAGRHIENVRSDLQTLKENMDDIPVLIREVQKDLPAQFQEIRFGCRDLKAEGYDLEHIKVEGKLSTLKGKLNLVEPLISRLDLDEARRILDDINNQVDDILELIEIEVKAKIKVDQDQPLITDELFHARNSNYTLRTEIQYMQDRFYINDSDIHSVQKFEHEIENLVDVYDEIITETSKTNARYSEVENRVSHIKDQILEINDEQEKIQEHLINLREDAEEAKENAVYIEDKKEKVYRKLVTSNLPEVPERFVIIKNELDINLSKIEEYFSKRPLNVQYIKDKVNQTVMSLNEFEQEAYELLRDAELAEIMIQYGNRYRRDDHAFDKQIRESERMFKESRYKRSLEIIKGALEKVEPGAARKIENDYDEK